MNGVIVKEGDEIILKVDTGEGILYTVTGSLIQPFEMIKTLSKIEVSKHETE